MIRRGSQAPVPADGGPAPWHDGKVMKDTLIHCPKCGGAFEPSVLMREQIEGQVRAQLHAQMDVELTRMRAQLTEAHAKEAVLLKEKRELNAQKEDVERTVERRIAEEQRRWCDREAKVIRERCDREAAEAIRQKEAEVTEARAKLGLAAEREAELLKLRRQLEEREERLSLDFERRIADEKKRIKDEEQKLTEARAALEREQQGLREEEHRQTIASLQKNVAELQRRIQQGSQQTQGEAQEVLLFELLAEAFDTDLIEDVPKGVHGADLLQRVRTSDGRDCGTIAWESKRTKTWSDSWLPKLRDDQRAVGAACAILVTQELPKDIRHCGMKDGVWVAAWPYAAALGAAVRSHLIEVAVAKRVAEGRGEKMQMLYEYMTGAECRNRIGGLVEALAEMHADLEREKRAMNAIWKKREKQMLRARDNLTAFYGDLRGIGGQKLEDLPQLELSPENLLGPEARAIDT
jgi:hypothetical protein